MNTLRMYGSLPGEPVVLGNPELVRLAEGAPRVKPGGRLGRAGVQVAPVPPPEPLPRGRVVEAAEIAIRAAGEPVRRQTDPDR